MIEQLANAIITHGIPEHIRSDIGSEFIAKELRKWLSGVGVKTAHITVLVTIAFVQALMVPIEIIF